MEKLLLKNVSSQKGPVGTNITGGDELVSINFKCNYDRSFVQEVA